MPLPDFTENLQPYLDTLTELLESQDAEKAAEIVKTATVSISETDFDNWNGGTPTWTLRFSIPPRNYSQLISEKNALETQIDRAFSPVWSQLDAGWLVVEICPRIALKKRHQISSGEIPQSVRQNILDGMRLDGIRWQGNREDAEFLSRIFDLEQLPSFDSRFRTAAEDIWQHRVNNYDWEDDWIFTDKRFQLLDGPTDTFLKFICEVVHPITQPSKEISGKLVSDFNDQLSPYGWVLVEEERIAGRHRYIARQENSDTNTQFTRAHEAANTLDANWMSREIRRIEVAIDTDPDLAIGAAKDLLERC